MIELQRLRELLLCALALYVATSLSQLHTTDKAWARGISAHSISVAFQRYAHDMADTERYAGDMFAIGD